MRNLFIFLIGLYQKTVSPDHGPLRHLHTYGYCRHEPTCSEYGKQVVREKGVLVGGLLIVKRILSCHPWKKVSEKKVMKVVHGNG